MTTIVLLWPVYRARSMDSTRAGYDPGGFWMKNGNRPSVMLSPNATNLVAEIRGGGGGGCVTVTVKRHEAVRCLASVAVQSKLVAPTGNDDPLAGKHPMVTGVAPPAVVGGAK